MGVATMKAEIKKAYEIRHHYLIWCAACLVWHWHGKAEGHRAAHCTAEHSPYLDTGYVLKRAGFYQPWFTSNPRRTQAPDPLDIWGEGWTTECRCRVCRPGNTIADLEQINRPNRGAA